MSCGVCGDGWDQIATIAEAMKLKKKLKVRKVLDTFHLVFLKKLADKPHIRGENIGKLYQAEFEVWLEQVGGSVVCLSALPRPLSPALSPRPLSPPLSPALIPCLRPHTSPSGVTSVSLHLRVDPPHPPHPLFI